MRTRSVRIAVFPDGRVRVSAPSVMPDSVIERYVKSKAAWIKKHVTRMEERKANSFLPKALPGDYERYRGQALRTVQELIARFAPVIGVKVAGVSIRRQKSRWGSCSRKGRLNFNYRIVFLPAEMAEYIAVHELCHLKEFNHSKRFWDLVASILPDHKRIRRTLREGSIE
ncbi:MAG: M48 family metallopeptidase [Candidatus Saccharibacteria bacterium]